MRIIGFVNGHSPLQDDDAVVEMLVDKMHGAPCDFDAVVEGLLLRVKAGKGGEQRWMDIQNALRKGLR